MIFFSRVPLHVGLFNPALIPECFRTSCHWPSNPRCVLNGVFRRDGVIQKSRLVRWRGLKESLSSPSIPFIINNSMYFFFKKNHFEGY